MATARFAWGIDIGNRALKAIKLVRSGTGLRVDDFEVIEHENVLSNSGDNRESLIRSALSNFVQRHAIKGSSVGISVSGVSSFARFIKLPPVEKKKIPEIVRFEAVQQIPFPLDEVEWAYQLFQAPDSPEVEVGIFAMRKELINQQIQYFTELDLNVQVVQMNPLAVYNAMYYDSRLKGPTMMVDLGAENTDLIIADGESVWLRSIPIGGNNFTEVLVKSFKLPFAKAEELKRNANTSKYARQIFQAMRPVFADLVAEIQRSMGFYGSMHRDSQIKKIVALGGTFRLAGLQKYLQQNLQMEVEKINELTAGAPSDAKLAATFNQNLLSLVSAYGLAVQAMGEAKITSSLLPQYIRREKMWRDKTQWFGAAAAAFVMGAGLGIAGYFLQQFTYKQGQTARSNNDTVLANARNLDQQWQQQVENAGANDRLKITNTRAMLDSRTFWPNFLVDLSAALPPLPPGYAQGDAEQIKAVPRDQRELVLIDRMQSQYFDDVSKNVPADTTVGASKADAAAQVPAAPGFVITLDITTPHRNAYTYVLNNVVKGIKQKMGRDALDKYNSGHPKILKNYYIAKVIGPSGQTQLKDDQARLTMMQNAYNAALALEGKGPLAATAMADIPETPGPNYGVPGQDETMPPGMPPGGFGPHGIPWGALHRSPPMGGADMDQQTAPWQGAPQPAGGPAAPADDKPFLDPVTGEDRRSDWKMKLILVVVTDTNAKAAAPPAAAAPVPAAPSQDSDRDQSI